MFFLLKLFLFPVMKSLLEYFLLSLLPQVPKLLKLSERVRTHHIALVDFLLTLPLF